MEFERMVNRVFYLGFLIGVVSGAIGGYLYQVGNSKSQALGNIFLFVSVLSILFSTLVKVSKFDKLPKSTYIDSTTDDNQYPSDEWSGLRYGAPESMPSDPYCQSINQCTPGSGDPVSEMIYGD